MAFLTSRAPMMAVGRRSACRWGRFRLNRPWSSHWVAHHQNVLITGPTGCGKTFVACALAHKACREGYRALYFYAPKLFRALSTAHADGSLSQLFKKIAKAQVLVVDDWGLAKIDERQYREFLEILDDRHGQGSTLMTSQFPVNAWHEAIPDPTVADALLDRLIHNAYRIELKGDSLRKRQSREAESGGFLPPSREASKGTKKEGENGPVVPLTRDSDNVRKGQKA